MPRPWVLVFLVLLIVFGTQFEWKEQLVEDIEASSSISRKEKNGIKREEVVKEKIILSQEKKIQKLNVLVKTLQEQLTLCRGENSAVNGTTNALIDHSNELEQQPILED
ncbi:hypothetical protein K2173_010453 [Erythroxylum novogranatense]|uniref:Uncharacterized protein n=1 Tax=Erythroxylum novogranatense TaxID=1862640 RepID=A0AAV8UE74_9ROSI|nr:hypothetical protein K2173_010453 [Erythroxylum novogranatense]